MIAFYGILVMLAVIAAIFGLCLLVIWLEKRLPARKYDERQALERGKACQFSLGVGWVYFLAVLVLQVIGIPVEGYLLTMGGFMLTAVSFLFYSAVTDSNLPFSRSPIGPAVSFLILGIHYVIRFFEGNDPVPNPLSFTGRGAFGWIWLMLAVACFCGSGVYAWMAIRRARE